MIYTLEKYKIEMKRINGEIAKSWAKTRKWHANIDETQNRKESSFLTSFFCTLLISLRSII